jgi:hypothetical protein
MIDMASLFEIMIKMGFIKYIDFLEDNNQNMLPPNANHHNYLTSSS